MDAKREIHLDALKNIIQKAPDNVLEGLLRVHGFKVTSVSSTSYGSQYPTVTTTYTYRGKKASPAQHGGNGGCGGAGGDAGKVYLIGFANSNNFGVHSEAGK